MNDTSQRLRFAVLAGIVLNLAFTFFIPIAFWGPLISVVVAVYLARVTTPNAAAVAGAAVFLPSSVVIVIQTVQGANTVSEIGLPLTVLVGLIGVLAGMSLGGLFGFLIGKFLEIQTPT